MQTQKIFNYSTLTPYLQDFLLSKKDNPAYSFRSMANKVKKISHSHLYQVFSGKRKLPIELAEDLSQKILKLDCNEMRYFKALVEVDHHLDSSVDTLDVQELEKKLFLLKPREIKVVDVDDIITRPLTILLFMMIERKILKNIKNISPAIFMINYEEKLICESFQYLVDFKLISVDGEGNITKLVRAITSNNDIPNKYKNNYHKQISQIAAEVIDEIDPSNREFQNLIFNIKKSNLPKAKMLIRTFLDDFFMAMNDDVSLDTMDGTYSLNIQFFPLLKDLNEKH